MDDQRFDRLARTLARGVGRRGLVGGLVAGAAIVLGGGDRRRGRAQTTCAEECGRNETCVDGACVRGCRKDRDCKSSEDACIGGTCENGVCAQFIVDCVPGYLCCGNGRCCPVSCLTDIDCFSPLPCTVGRCGTEGVCEFSERPACVTCAGDAECAASGAGFTCCNGACIAPCPVDFVMSKGCECHAVTTTGGANGTIVVNTDEGASDTRSGPDPTTTEPAPTAAPGASPEASAPVV